MNYASVSLKTLPIRNVMKPQNILLFAYVRVRKVYDSFDNTGLH